MIEFNDQNIPKIFPAITLYQPWAYWIIKGFKTIETRTHNRFASLKGQRILIHAGLTMDWDSFRNNPYLSNEQMSETKELHRGHILGSAYVRDVRPLTPLDAPQALIECFTDRFGLILSGIDMWDTPIKCAGSMGIWYFDLETIQKVPKPTKRKERRPME